MPLRTGVARMVLGTEGDAAPPGTTLLPIGLTFHEPETFRTGWALVLVGAPVPVEDCRAMAAREPERAVRELTARVAEALRAVIVEVEDRETLRLAEGLEAIRRAEAEDAPGAAGRSTSRAERVAWVQVATRAYRWLAPRAPGRVARFRAEVESYLADLERIGLSPDVVARAYPPGTARRYALREGLALLGGLPLAAWGLASHALPYWLTSARRAVAPNSGRRHGDDQADRRRRPLSRVLGPRGLGRLPAAGRLGARRLPRGPDSDGTLRPGLAGAAGARSPRRPRLPPVPRSPRSARAARGAAPRPRRGDREAGAAPSARGAGGRRRPRRSSATGRRSGR